MPDRKLLEQIWDGAVAVADPGARGPVAQAIAARLPVATVVLTIRGGAAGPRILPESHELMPDLALGDVLAEELDVHVPYGAFVVLEGSEFSKGDTLGEQYIEWLLDVALLDLANLADVTCTAAEDEAALEMARFRAGSAASLGALFKDHRLGRRFTRMTAAEDDRFEAWPVPQGRNATPRPRRAAG